MIIQWKCIYLFSFLLCSMYSEAQVYIVNSTDDLDDGKCDSVHCSLREAILASESDGVASQILFKLSGGGPYYIHPTQNFPTITQNDLKIKGESQQGGPVVIDFNYRQFTISPFWKITGSNVQISSLGFVDFLYSKMGYSIIQFGDDFSNASNCVLKNCLFNSEDSQDTSNKYLVYIYKANNIRISSCKFGTDHANTHISEIIGQIFIHTFQFSGVVTIDSSIFLNKNLCIEANSGDLKIHHNIFGSLDTNRTANFLFPSTAIKGFKIYDAAIRDNYFYGYIDNVIEMEGVYKGLSILNNAFYENPAINTILLYNNTTGPIYINHNSADILNPGSEKKDRSFINALDDNTVLEINDNYVKNYGNFLIASQRPARRSIEYKNNEMQCIWSNAVINPGYSRPTVRSVNKNAITGTGNPNDSVFIYYNKRINCADAICQGGNELGRTKCDSSGYWDLRKNYPNRSSISAYQFGRDPLGTIRYSEFSDCYSCLENVIIDYNPVVCQGEIVVYRSRIYSENNPWDQILISGDGISICDTIINVQLMVHPAIDTVIVRDGIHLIAGADSARYQWLDCEKEFQAIQGDTHKVFKAMQNGVYAVMISKDHCIDTSECYPVTIVDVRHSSNNTSFIFYPNPAKTHLNIFPSDMDTDIHLSIYDITSKLIFSKDYTNGNVMEIDLTEHPNGVYFAELKMDRKMVRKKFIKRD
jgi:CSLREA domain-containing protein